MKLLNVRIYSLALIAVLASAQAVHAQGSVSTEQLNMEVDAELNKVGVTQPAQKSVVTQAIVVQPATVQAVEIQKQPVTLIESTPLSASNADGIRKNRQEEELRTETRIVEKLEKSRLEDEKRRASVLFGDKFDALDNQSAHSGSAVITTTVAPAPVQVQAAPAVVVAEPIVAPSSNVQPKAIVIEKEPSLTREDINQEVRAALDADKEESMLGNFMETKYVAGVAGLSMYPDANLIKPKYSLGVAFGTNYNGLLVEAGYMYSKATMDAAYVSKYNPWQTYYANFGMNQHQGYIMAKYQFMNGAIRPSAGGVLSYSYRSYVSETWTTDGGPGTEFGKSHAFDLGLAAGVDFLATQSMSLGADFRYMFNLTNSLSGDTAPGYKSPESLSYFLLGAVARFNF